MVARRLQPLALDALPEEPLVQTGGADQSVDDSGRCRHLAEGQAEQRGHEIEPRDGNESQFSAPTTTSTDATTSIAFMCNLLSLNIMK